MNGRGERGSAARPLDVAGATGQNAAVAPADESPAPTDSGTAASLRARVAAGLALVAASVLYRLPSLANAEGTNADAAVVGLQAMHILRGEHAAYLWGSGYQTAADSYVAAAFFAVLGPTGLALRLSTLTGHVVLTLAVFGMLARRLRVEIAALVAAILVLTPDTLHTYILYPPRQLSLTLSFVGLYLADSCAFTGPSRRYLRLGGGAALGTLAVGADPYTLLFLPLWGLFALLLILEEWPGDTGPRWRSRLSRGGVGLGAAALGALPYLWLLRQPSHSGTTLTLNLDDVQRRYKLLVEECFPALVSTRVYSYAPDGSWGPYPFSAPVTALQHVGAWLFLGAIASGFVLVFARRIPWSVRRIGLVGAAALPLTLAAFLASGMVMDRHSSRYLAAIVLFAPLAVAPLSWLLQDAPSRSRRAAGWLRVAAVLAPYLASAAVTGWTSYRPWTDGLRIDRTWGRHADEQALFRALEERHIRYAIADYWASYRLTFLWKEAILVVPKHPSTDRYPPLREAFSTAERVAYIHDPERSDESPDAVAEAVAAGKTPFQPSFEGLRAGPFTVLILTRREPAPNLW